MKSINLLLGAVCLLSASLFAQTQQTSPERIRKNGISRIETYSLDACHAGDSLLTAVEVFNRAGFRTRLEEYNRFGLRKAYEYMYTADSVEILHNAYVGKDKTLDGTTFPTYDKQGRLIRSDTHGNRRRTASSRKKYDKSGQLIYESNRYRGRTQLRSKYTYRDGKIAQIARSRPYHAIHEYVYDSNGDEIERYEVRRGVRSKLFDMAYDSQHRLIRVIFYCTERCNTSTVEGSINVYPGDTRRTEYSYQDRDLPASKTQYINNITVSSEVYKYFP